MQTEIKLKEKTLTACLSGEIDHHSAAFARAQIDEAITTSKPEKMILDFTEVSFMDSSGIGLVMGRYKLLHTQGCPLVLCGLSPHIEKVMRLAGLEQIVTIEKKQKQTVSKQKEIQYESQK